VGEGELMVAKEVAMVAKIATLVAARRVQNSSNNSKQREAGCRGDLTVAMEVVGDHLVVNWWWPL